MNLTQMISVRTVILMILLKLCLTGCGSDESTSRNIDGITIEMDTDIAISVFIPRKLEQHLEVEKRGHPQLGIKNKTKYAEFFGKLESTERLARVITRPNQKMRVFNWNLEKEVNK